MSQTTGPLLATTNTAAATTEKTIDETAGDTATATLTEMDEMEDAYRMEGEEEEEETCTNCGSVHSHIDTACATAIENGLA